MLIRHGICEDMKLKRMEGCDYCEGDMTLVGGVYPNVGGRIWRVALNVNQQKSHAAYVVYIIR